MSPQLDKLNADVYEVLLKKLPLKLQVDSICVSSNDIAGKD